MFEPIKTGKMRDVAMLRGGANFGAIYTEINPDHHEVLKKHGYSYTGTDSKTGVAKYSHPSGTEAHNHRGQTTLHLKKGGRGITTGSAALLGHELERAHGPAKHSDEGQGAKFDDEQPEGVDRYHHTTLLQHGYKYQGKDLRSGAHIYKGPKGEHVTHHEGKTIQHPEHVGGGTTVSHTPQDLDSNLGGRK